MTGTRTNNKHLKIAVGTDNFKKMATEYDVFVDKTLFIKEIIDSSEEAILITHPRRWGKTLNLDMLKTFFELESEECKKKQLKIDNYAWYKPWTYGSDTSFTICNRDIFIGGKFAISSGEKKELNTLKISNIDSGEYMKYQGKYPVIFISLKDVVGNTVGAIEGKLKWLISSTYESYSYLKDSSKLLDSEKIKFQKYIDQDYTGINIEESIKFLSGLLHKHHGTRVYILVDEYDKPVNSLLENYLGQEKTPEKEALIKDITKLISYTVCSSISKTNPALEKLILTGIFDTTQKESGSGCNNVSVYGIADIKFSKSFGFSKNEIEGLTAKLEFKNSQDIVNNIKSWYNGYYVPVSTEENLALYTPWAAMKYLNIAYSDNDYTPQNYWSKSGASTILQMLFTKEKCLNTKISDKFLDISINGTYELKFDKQISLFKYDWFTNSDKEEFFSYLLLNSGYLTVQRDNNIYKFSIPNAELLEEFTSIIPNNSEQCKAIIYNLQKTSHLKVLEMIKQKDAEGTKKELSESHIKCEDKSMNFNFFHLASIFGDKKVFQALLESECKKQLDFANDRVGNLKAIDYAFMLKNTDIMDVITTHYQDKNLKSIELPGWGSSIICYGYYNTITSGGVSGSLDLLKDVILDRFGISIAAKLGINIIASITNMFGSSSVEKQCNQYAEYSDIDISDPSKFDSLKQLQKYLLTHKEATVVINNDCGNQQKLSELKYNIFENSFYSDEEITFTLCDQKDLKEDL